MDRERLRDPWGQAAFEYFLDRPREPRRERERPSAQTVPVNVYQTEEHVVIVAPMPGVEAENIDIEVNGTTVSLRASLRGRGQEDRHYLLHEWTYGPYTRTIELPTEVDAENANASHHNGVLVLSLPRSIRSRSVRVPLKQVGSSTAEREGHSGRRSGPDTP